MRRLPCLKLSFAGPRAEVDAAPAKDRLTTWWPRRRHMGCDVQAPPKNSCSLDTTALRPSSGSVLKATSRPPGKSLMLQGRSQKARILETCQCRDAAPHPHCVPGGCRYQED